MQTSYTTQRLSLTSLTIDDADFIMELVNSPEWIKFIGQRNIKSSEDAIAYIQKIIANPDVDYWIVNHQEQKIPIGIITFIKRDYLNHHDIGFAFLAKYTRQGYAYEATKIVLADVITNSVHSNVLATTIKENNNSIQLLIKLGFSYSHEIEQGGEKLLVYEYGADKLIIDRLTKSFFNLFTNTNNQQPDWSLIHQLCIPETLIIKKTDEVETVYTLSSFIEPRKKILSDGTLTEFEESEISNETKITSNIAQRFSKYKKTGNLNGKYFHEYGNKLFQFIKTQSGWRINSLIWEDDKPENTNR